MHKRLIDSRWQFKVCALIDVHAVAYGLKQRAPGALREVEACHFLGKIHCIDGSFECWADHHVVGYVCVCTIVIWEFEEQRLVNCAEGKIAVGSLGHLGVVVSHEVVLAVNCILHNVHVRLSSSLVKDIVFESPSFLSITPASTMIS